MKIISWNVNGIRAAYKKGLLEFLQAQNPDIFCVQETKAHLEQIEEPFRSPRGMTGFWSSAEKKGYSGTATFLKPGVEVIETIRGIGVPRFDSEGRFVLTRHPNFDLYNVYFPNGASGRVRHDYKMDFLQVFGTHLRQQLAIGKNIILVGDYNIAPEPIDIYDPVRHAMTSGFLEEERAWFKSLMTDGFVDTFRHVHPEAKARYSWWNQMERARINNRGWRIDFIAVSKGLAPRIKSADLFDHIEGSDHCPAMLELE
jgi:exodeoxyribonuclease-3